MYHIEKKILKKGFNLYLVVSGKDLISILSDNSKRVKKYTITEDIDKAINVMFMNTMSLKEESFIILLKKIFDNRKVDFKNISSIFSSYKIENSIYEQGIDLNTKEFVINKVDFNDSEKKEVIDRIEFKISPIKILK